MNEALERILSQLSAETELEFATITFPIVFMPYPTFTTGVPQCYQQELPQ